MKTIGTWLVDIPPSECEELLKSSTLGRLAVVVNGRPEIFPVNHVFDEVERCVVFPSNAHTKLHAALDWPYVAFEIDGMDADQPSGWSVLVVGRAEEVQDTDAIEHWCARRGIVWRCGQQTHWLRIVAEKVTGRRISGPAA
jgi:nitroimidazol reductase NimA-like FMN-containing flavoprotein (pyridoxamine 5'-phosphate oxidase superfamily)